MDRILTTRHRLFVLIIALVGLGAVSLSVRAAEIQHQAIFIGPVGQIRVGESLPLEIQLDSGGQRINAAELVLHYDPSVLTVERIARERSMFTLWPEEPSWDDRAGLVRLTGGRPGGLYAVRGLVATVYFLPLRGGTTTMTLEAGSASYLNDNAGTQTPISAESLELHVASDLLPTLVITSPTHPAPTSWSRVGRIIVRWKPEASKEYSYHLSSDVQALPDDTLDEASGELDYDQLADGIYYFTIKERLIQSDWQPIIQRRFLVDGTPPAAFTIEKVDAAAVQGQQVISWGALDSTSGVTRSVLAVDGKTIGVVTSPLVLKPDWLGKQIRVTVVDAAGNSRSNVWPAALTRRSMVWPWVFGFLGIVAVLGAILFIRRSKLFH